MTNTFRTSAATLVVALAVLLAAATVTAQAPAQTPTPKPSPSPSPSPSPAPTLAGKWTMTLEIPMGTATPALEFVQQGEKITGSYEGRYGKFPLEGVLKNRVLEFSVTLNAEGTETTLSFKGEVAVDFKSIIKGTADLGGMGEAAWSAVKK